MKKDNLEYLILMLFFCLFLFGSSINKLYILFNKDLSNNNIVEGINEELKKEYDNLLELNNFKLNSDINLVVSKVKFRDIYDFNNQVTIYKGVNDFIKKGDAVLTNNGLIGIIDKVNKNESVVKLITNKNTNVSVRINESYGVLKYQDKKLIVKEISNYDNIVEGNLIYTSGLGKLPGGIYIGKVKSISLNETKIEKVIEVEIQENLDNINYLYISGVSND